MSWDRSTSMRVADMQRTMQQIGRDQAALMIFVLAWTEDLGEDASEMGILLFLVILRAFQKTSPKKIRMIKPAKIEAALASNEKFLANFEQADDRFVERAAEIGTSRQPYLFQFVTEVLMQEPDDPDAPHLSPEEQGQLFLTLKTVIDVLDEAVSKQPQ